MAGAKIEIPDQREAGYVSFYAYLKKKKLIIRIKMEFSGVMGRYKQEKGNLMQYND